MFCESKTQSEAKQFTLVIPQKRIHKPTLTGDQSVLQLHPALF